MKIPWLRRITVYPPLICVLAFLAGTMIMRGYENQWRQEQQMLLKDVAASQAELISRRLSRSLSATYILASILRQQNGELENFEAYAEDIISSNGGITNLQLAPDGIVSRIYPLAGHEKALGHKILQDDARKADAHKAIATKALTLAGPFNLVQGGKAVIGRNPVFLKNELGDEQFWGFTSALIYLDDLLASTDLYQLEEKGYLYKLSRIDPATGEAICFVGSGWRSLRLRPAIPSWCRMPSGY